MTLPMRIVEQFTDVLRSITNAYLTKTNPLRSVSDLITHAINLLLSQTKDFLDLLTHFTPIIGRSMPFHIDEFAIDVGALGGELNSHWGFSFVNYPQRKCLVSQRGEKEHNGMTQTHHG